MKRGASLYKKFDIQRTKKILSIRKKAKRLFEGPAKTSGGEKINLYEKKKEGRQQNYVFS